MSPTIARPESAHSDLPRDNAFPGGTALVRVPSHGVLLNAIFFRASGAGLHPLLVLLHGFPGVEQNYDLAHAARRAGWNVIIPHYRGAWGSPGGYAWAHVLEDTDAVVAWARTECSREAYAIDARTIVLAGHSLGGWAALTTAAHDPAIAAAVSIAGFNFGAFTRRTRDNVAQVAEDWSEPASVLANTSGRALADEAYAAGDAWDLGRMATTLVGLEADRPLLLVAASADEVAVPDLHHEPLVAAVADAGARALTQRVLHTDHSFADTRVALAELLVQWLDWVPGAP